MKRIFSGTILLFRKIYYRLSGLEARSLYSQLCERNVELEFAKNENVNLMTIIQSLTQTRSNRLHPYISETIALATEDLTIRVVEESRASFERLKGIFSMFGSDKETRHSYAETYAELLFNFKNPSILEIGLGSTNGFPYGGLAPGGSIRAWRQAFPSALIVGVDIDPESVTAINEIGFVADQTSQDSLDRLKEHLQEYKEFDLIVDDGFHDAHANFRTLKTLLPLLSASGSYVIEDVHETLIDFWKLVSLTIPAEMEIRDLRSERPETDDNVLLIFRNYNSMGK